MSEIITMQPGVVANLPLDVIDLDPDQPRKDIDGDYIAELGADIKVRGVLQPITVRPGKDAGRYIIKYGECRYRGSVLAKTGTIPALLDTEEQHGDGLSRLLDQVKENHIRRGLNPMEWANVLIRMRREHHIRSLAAVEETLREHGITNMGRSYISNMMRLVDLPEWAQEKIRNGELTAAHGKYLLPATASETVLEQVRAQIADESPSVRRLQDLVFWAFQQLHPNVDRPWGIHFDYKIECVQTGCQKMRKVSRENASCTFCLDKACFDTKQKAGLERQEAAQQEAENAPPVIPIIAEDGSVDVNAQPEVTFTPMSRAPFDPDTCLTCEHMHLAKTNDHRGEPTRIHACFNRACFVEKTRAHQGGVTRRIQMDSVLKKWLTAHVSEKLSDDVDAQLAVITIAALDNYEYRLEGFNYQLDDHRETALEACGIHRIGDVLEKGAMTYAQRIATELLQAAEIALLIGLAKHFGITIDDYRIDEDYLEHLDDAGLQQLMLTNATAWTESTEQEIREISDNLDSTELIALIVNKADNIATPGEILEAWDRAMASAKRAAEEAERGDEEAA